MILNMLRKDLAHNKGITIALIAFVVLACLLIATGTRMIMDLTGSLQQLFVQSKTPHVVQMHDGQWNEEQLTQWSKNNEMVKQYQFVPMLNIDGSNVTMAGQNEGSSIMDMYFVRQNTQFDFLLNLKGEQVVVDEGEIAVPIYYMEQRQLQIGDQLHFTGERFDRTYTIVDYVRDSQMNASIVHSKRFVIHDSDFQLLQQHIGQVEYLFEFRLHDYSQLSTFIQSYADADLPNQGPMIDYALFKMLNAITDGLIAAVVIIVSVILIGIALLCIRFTLLATLEEDYRSIGVMKAIGISHSVISSMYMVKYIFISIVAAIIGYGLSLYIYSIFSGNMWLYLGEVPATISTYVVTIGAVMLVIGLVVLFCMNVLRKFKRIAVVEALRSGSMKDTVVRKNRMPLSQSSSLPLSIFLGLKDIIQRPKIFRLLFTLFVITTFIAIVPLNFLTTIQSPSFISYMGIGQSDIRIDLRSTSNIEQRYEQLLTYAQKDKDVVKLAGMQSSQYKMKNEEEGTYENITVERGEFTVFPLDYLEGRAPMYEGEIALSYTNSKELGKGLDDLLILRLDQRDVAITVVGIYQDITNGGRTAKANLDHPGEATLWYVINLDVADDANLTNKIKQYEEQFSPAKVTDLQGYLNQTLGNTTKQLQLVTWLAIAVAIIIIVLITTLFMKLIIAKDKHNINIMRNIGISERTIGGKYIVISLVVIFISILLGLLFAHLLGQPFVSILMSFFGASKITFIVNPLWAYLYCPLLLIATAVITTLGNIMFMDKRRASRMTVE
ncbi:ABC transporter permease [Paenibacillus endoradicis]|uniref:ABC transporter permease n=1 Tax=Paenibacillus endoradicis TaxID=2972487 RepID=UPI0021598E8E|nr:ABC transporter permease [Paenibacillus endoradicis]MCR8657626.1 ABC transporter permease [Paenibacillus endoradicis]